MHIGKAIQKFVFNPNTGWTHAQQWNICSVLEKAKKLNITIGFIPPGLTSILQICDLIINKLLKASCKKNCCSYKIRSDHGTGGKVQVHRSDILVWVKESICDLQEKLKSTNAIARCFHLMVKILVCIRMRIQNFH
ncbi:hypothetical protein THRCLA_21479 [Thraustotheca clavata]|uniref:Uncharacterized protein n=1 Tax=Thraustotheca clavata TaxID=74557 RepID=A0A1V9ZW80_9STRA|nr:hypothetical protein THRCLA_21479 [Thraustotheca clavata]